MVTWIANAGERIRPGIDFVDFRNVALEEIDQEAARVAHAISVRPEHAVASYRWKLSWQLRVVPASEKLATK